MDECKNYLLKRRLSALGRKQTFIQSSDLVSRMQMGGNVEMRPDGNFALRTSGNLHANMHALGREQTSTIG